MVEMEERVCEWKGGKNSIVQPKKLEARNAEAYLGQG